jgi:leader peptidase (prepilin peptidase)/N-methyltransferase
MCIFSFLFGLAFGSFVNVCIHRIPLKRSIITPPSSCPECGENIKFYDNIPIISYIILFGRCRYCGHSISWRYPVVETMTGLFSLGLFIKYGLNYQYILLFLFLAALVTISFIDIQHKIIPDVISLPGIVVGWTASFVLPYPSWMDSLIGIIAGGGILFLVSTTYERLTGRAGMGGGDIKLLAMIGAWMGWRSLFPVIMISSFTGAVIGSVALMIAGKGLRFRIPFGPFLSLGATVYLFLGDELVQWYFTLFE